MKVCSPYGDLIAAAALLLILVLLRLYSPVLIAQAIRKGQWIHYGPEFWPNTLLHIGIFLGALQVFFMARSHISRPRTSTQETATSRELLRVFRVLGILVLYAWAIPRAGFIPSTVLMVAVYLLALGQRRPLVVLSISVLLPLLVLVVFTRILVVPLPRGIGIFRAWSYFLY